MMQPAYEYAAAFPPGRVRDGKTGYQWSVTGQLGRVYGSTRICQLMIPDRQEAANVLFLRHAPDRNAEPGPRIPRHDAMAQLHPRYENCICKCRRYRRPAYLVKHETVGTFTEI